LTAYQGIINFLTMYTPTCLLSHTKLAQSYAV